MAKKKYPKEEPCPLQYKHTPEPEGYMQWHEWAEKKSKTHKQIKCPGCNHYAIWITKKSDGRAARRKLTRLVKDFFKKGMK